MDTITLTTDTLADQLAAACGAGDLAAAAAIDAEEGDRFLHARLADQMAGAHLLTMRMAALADRAISAAADGSGQGPANLPLFDLAAARFAGAAARLNGRYCRALQTLNILSSSTDEEDEVEWVGIATEPDTLSPEERARRINRMKTYRKIQARGKPNRKPGPRRRRIDAAEQASLVAAEHAARDLLTPAATASSTASVRPRSSPSAPPRPPPIAPSASCLQPPQVGRSTTENTENTEKAVPPRAERAFTLPLCPLCPLW